MVKGHYYQSIGIPHWSRSTTHIFFFPPVSILPLPPGGGGVHKDSFSYWAPSIHGTLPTFLTSPFYTTYRSLPPTKTASPSSLYRCPYLTPLSLLSLQVSSAYYSHANVHSPCPSLYSTPILPLSHISTNHVPPCHLPAPRHMSISWLVKLCFFLYITVISNMV